MISLKTLFSLLFLVACIATSVVAKKKEDEEQALRDVQLGLQGLKEATQNPALLAQMMRDLQNPELMAEAKKMMDNPEYQRQMKKITESKDFKESMKKTNEMLSNPNEAAKMEAKVEHMMKRGNDDLKKAAGATMEEAMAAMSNPEVMAEMTRMMKDPKFQQQMAAMTRDPSFQQYAEAMQDMMKDPEKKRRLEKVSAQMRSAM